MKSRIGKFVVPVLLLATLVASVSAVAYVLLQWTTTATVVANPKVCFIQWSDVTKVNTFNYAVDFFPSVTLINENITYGIWNWDTANHTASMRINSITSSSNIANVTTYVKTGGGSTVITVTWATAGGLPTTYQEFTAIANTQYTIWTEITGTSGASGSSVITYDLKVENP